MEWYVYYLAEPFGEERDDLRSGIVASVIANSNRDPKRHPKPYEPKDFMPNLGQPSGRSDKKPLTDPAAWAKFKNAIKSAHNKTGA